MALSWLGYRTTSTFPPVASHPHDYFSLDSKKWQPYLDDDDGSGSTSPPLQPYLSAMDTFTDCPWLYLYKELDERYPGSRFILTLRSIITCAGQERDETLERVGAE